MIKNQVELIERIVAKTRIYGICWACSKRFECRDRAKKYKENFEYESECINFDERAFLNSDGL